MDLFTHAMNDRMQPEAPLAARMRPLNLDEYIGQEHIIGPGKSDLRECIEKAQERRKLFGVRKILFVKEVAIV